MGDFEFSNSSLSSRTLVFAVAVFLGIGVMAILKSMVSRDAPAAAVSEEREGKPRNALKRVQLSPKKLVQPEPVAVPPATEPAPVVQNTVRVKKATRARVASVPAQPQPKFVAAPKMSIPVQQPKPAALAPTPAPTAPAPVSVAVTPPTPVSVPVPVPVSRPEPVIAVREDVEVDTELDDPVFESQASHRREVDSKIKIDEPKKKSANKGKDRDKEKRIDIAQQKSGPQTFKDRLKKSRQEVGESAPATDTATSSFQDRLRKSVK